MQKAAKFYVQYEDTNLSFFVFFFFVFFFVFFCPRTEHAECNIYICSELEADWAFNALVAKCNLIGTVMTFLLFSLVIVQQALSSQEPSGLCQPIRVVEQGNYHVIVVTECSRVQHPMISMLFIP